MNQRFFAKKTGYTMVEMLIVLIVVGILVGMILIVGCSVINKATATRIVSDMRHLRSACLMFYSDNHRWPTGNEGDICNLFRCYCNGQLNGKGRDYEYSLSSSNNGLFVICVLDDSKVKNQKLCAELAKMAHNCHLYGINDSGKPGNTFSIYDGHGVAYMPVRRN